MSKPSSVALQSRVTCPHCWHGFAPEEILWISQHPDLLGDPRLGGDHQRRFLPTRFTVEGDAIDAQGFACQSLACPNCHLPVPRALVELQPVFASILGAPASGKSYFLAAMTWQLRRSLAQHFSLALTDADPAANRGLNEYEELLFHNSRQDDLVAIRKTELQGDLYDTVLFGQQTVSYPRPFVFSLSPLPAHPNHGALAQHSQAFCLYDNAGEHFMPGQDTVGSPVTRHLARARMLFFLFDPTQDTRFREACSGKTRDPQMRDGARTMRQESILAEAADRVRRHGGLGQGEQHAARLIVVVTKYDAWSSLMRRGPLEIDQVFKKTHNSTLRAVDRGAVEAVSAEVREVLLAHSPEIVTTAESFAQQVIYVPVSALGRCPELDPKTRMLGRPRDIRPVWVEVPMIYAICRWMKGLVPFFEMRPHAPAGGPSGAAVPSPPCLAPKRFSDALLVRQTRKRFKWRRSRYAPLASRCLTISR